MPAARHYDTILAPVITEKATLLSEQNKVVFKVAMDSTKDEIAAAVARLQPTEGGTDLAAALKAAAEKFSTRKILLASATPATAAGSPSARPVSRSSSSARVTSPSPTIGDLYWLIW